VRVLHTASGRRGAVKSKTVSWVTVAFDGELDSATGHQKEVSVRVSTLVPELSGEEAASSAPAAPHESAAGGASGDARSSPDDVRGAAARARLEIRPPGAAPLPEKGLASPHPEGLATHVLPAPASQTPVCPLSAYVLRLPPVERRELVLFLADRLAAPVHGLTVTAAVDLMAGRRRLSEFGLKHQV
jgi:hypothetical protein